MTETLDASLPPAGNRGRAMRWFVLIANALLVVVAAVGYRALFREYSIQTEWISAVQSGLEALGAAPLMVVCLIAAWGPWSPAKRAAFLLVAVAATVAAVQVVDAYVGAPRPRVHAWMWLSQAYLMYLTLIASGCICLACIGSLLRLRLGPAGLPPVRMTILGLMGATAILGILIALKGRIDLWTYETFLLQPHMSPQSPDPEQMYTVQAMFTVMWGGPAVALFASLSAASCFRWSARIIVVLFSVGVGALQYRLASWAPGFEWTSVAFAASPLLLSLWVAGSIALLDRSGWKLTRRLSS